MKLSIITINYNNATGLKATLESVAMQSYKEFEHIIIDGGSSDGSVPVIKSYEESIIANRFNYKTQYPLISWKSERDRGIYDAMNKGLQKACGEYVYFLNSGDTFVSSNIVRGMVNQMDGADFIIGRVNEVHHEVIVGRTPLLSEHDMSFYNMFLHGLNHQAVIIRRDVQLAHMYDETLRIGADWKFFVQAIVFDNAKLKFIDIVFANYDVSGISSNAVDLRNEREKILADILPERIARDYFEIAPYYYEVIRVKWLLRHPVWYKLYRGLTTLGRKITLK